LRKPILAVLALLLVPALAFAGKTVTQGNDTLKIKLVLDPAKASKSKEKLRATAATFDYMEDTTDGSRLEDLRSVVVNLGGPRFMFKAFPACDETDAAEKGDKVCPDGSLVGKGTGTAEVHGDINDPSQDSELELDVKLYNGSLDTDKDGSPMTPRPGLLIYTKLGDSNITIPFWGEKRGKQLAFRAQDEDPDPGVASLFEIKRIHIEIDRRSVRRDGKRVPYLALPTKCDGAWIASATADPYDGEPLTAKHKVRCTDA
jgi:hypothetical protein